MNRLRIFCFKSITIGLKARVNIALVRVFVDSEPSIDPTQ